MGRPKAQIIRPDYLDVYLVNLEGEEWTAYKRSHGTQYQMVDAKGILKRYMYNSTVPVHAKERFALWELTRQVSFNLNDVLGDFQAKRCGRSIWYRIDSTDEEIIQRIIEMFDSLSRYPLNVWLVDETGITRCIRPID